MSGCIGYQCDKQGRRAASPSVYSPKHIKIDLGADVPALPWECGGRSDTIVAKLQELAAEQGTVILLVTHDVRILDVADRIPTLQVSHNGPGRSVQESVLTMAELETLGVAFVVPGQIDMTTPTGHILAYFLAAVAEFERQLIRERVQSGPANAKAKGKSLGRPRAAPSLVHKALMLLDQGQTYQKAIKQTGLSVSTLIRARPFTLPCPL